MSNFIVEYIGKNGIKHTNADYGRMENPKSGDVIDFGDNVGTYPFTQGQYGRIWTVEKDRITFCCGMGSAFLMESGNVDISGGCFASCKFSDLQATLLTKATRVWNWGNNGSGAGMGVEYLIERPVFKLCKFENIFAERSAE